MVKHTGEKIHTEIIKYVNNEVSYLDALVYYAEKHDMELELLGEIIRKSPVLKSKIHESAEKFNLVEKDKNQLL